ncbi:hypothetical protein OAT67_00960 [Bacteriovoracaceae bacterium]|nr:hypothetical protein [Bacteriovoracaceae bacterium]
MQFKPLLAITFSSILLFSSCQPEEDITKDPVSELNSLVKEYGFIGFQNAMSRPEIGTHTGTLIGGKPTGLAYVSNTQTCFPNGDDLRRYTDVANINKKYNYSYKGNFGFLTLGIPFLSAGLNLNKSITVDIELDGLVIEYMDSIDVTDWYREGMSSTCREYLEDVGFFIQTIHTSSMKISLKRLGGTNIGLSSDNVGDYFQFETGVNWEVVDESTIEISTPHTLGYQIALMRPEDSGKALYRAMSTSNNEFVFEKIGFSDVNFPSNSSNKSLVEKDDIVELDTSRSKFD